MEQDRLFSKRIPLLIISNYSLLSSALFYIRLVIRHFSKTASGRSLADTEARRPAVERPGPSTLRTIIISLHNILYLYTIFLKPSSMKYYHFLVALFTTVMLFIPSCDPNYTGFWYIENQLDEDIIVTRSDSTEIHNVHIKAGDKGCIFQSASMGSASFFDFESSFSNPYKPDTLVILNMKLDTLFRLHPENQQDLLNKRFWDFDYWQSLIDHENRTQTLLFILENSYNE